MRALLAAFGLVFSLSACVSPVTYPAGMSIENLPPKVTAIFIESVSEGTMMGNAGITETSATPEDKERVNNLVRGTVSDLLASEGFGVVAAKDDGAAPVLMRIRTWYLPYNPILGGHVNIFIRLYDGADREVVSAFGGRDFTLLNLAIEDGVDGVVRSTAKYAGENLVKELKKRSATAPAP